MPNELRKEDLWDLRDALQAQIQDVRDSLQSQIKNGFDAMNGRVRTTEVNVARLDERVQSIEKRPVPAVVSNDRRTSARPVTWRDIHVAWGTLLGLIALIETLAHGGFHELLKLVAG